MTKPDRGKTKTVKQGAIYVYLPSLEMVEDWKGGAERAGVSISKFVMERVEDSIRKRRARRATSAGWSSSSA